MCCVLHEFRRGEPGLQQTDLVFIQSVAIVIKCLITLHKRIPTLLCAQCGKTGSAGTLEKHPPVVVVIGCSTTFKDIMFPQSSQLNEPNLNQRT